MSAPIAPPIEFVVVEAPESAQNKFDFQDLDDNSGFMATAADWVEENTQNLVHLPYENLNIWKGVEQEGAQAFQNWTTCMTPRGIEKPDKDPAICLEKGKHYINHTTTCENVFNETSFTYEVNCTYCVQMFNMTDPKCTTPCENGTSYINEFGEEVFDFRCADPFYQEKIDNMIHPTAPPALRIVFQIIALIMELHVVVIAMLPWYLILLAYMLLDWILDWFWYGIFFAWCLPCAWVFIWLFNIIFLPFTVWGYVNRFQLELIGFVFDFWLLFFNGDGCFLRWGNYCWFARRIPERDDMSYMDLVAFNKVEGQQQVTPNPFPGRMDFLSWIQSQMAINQDSFLSDDWFAVGREKRTALAETCPGMPETQAFFRDQFEKMVPFVENIYASAFDF